MSRFFLIIALCSLTGCITTPVKLNTSSGFPEVVISGSTKKKITDAIINRGISKGWILKSQMEYMVILTKKNTTFGAQLLFGSNYNSIPENRITFTMVETGDGIRLTVREEIVTNPNSSFEESRDLTLINQEAAEHYQKILEEIKTQVESLNRN